MNADGSNRNVIYKGTPADGRSSRFVRTVHMPSSLCLIDRTKAINIWRL